MMLIRGPLCAGFPIGVSYPHFYQGDPALVEAVEGSYPEKEKHESHFYIQSVSSTTPLLYT
jgi:CD36 family.